MQIILNCDNSNRFYMKYICLSLNVWADPAPPPNSSALCCIFSIATHYLLGKREGIYTKISACMIFKIKCLKKKKKREREGPVWSLGPTSKGQV